MSAWNKTFQRVSSARKASASEASVPNRGDAEAEAEPEEARAEARAEIEAAVKEAAPERRGKDEVESGGDFFKLGATTLERKRAPPKGWKDAAEEEDGAAAELIAVPAAAKTLPVGAVLRLGARSALLCSSCCRAAAAAVAAAA